MFLLCLKTDKKNKRIQPYLHFTSEYNCSLLLLVSFCLSSHLKSYFSLLSFYPLQQETTLCSCKDGSSSSLTISIEVSSSLAKAMLVTTCFISAISISSLYILLFFKSFSFHATVGHYVPQLAELMIQYNQKHHLFNLRGIAVSFKTPSHPPLIISITIWFFLYFPVCFVDWQSGSGVFN